jgi:hypothetical protein
VQGKSAGWSLCLMITPPKHTMTVHIDTDT